MRPNLHIVPRSEAERSLGRHEIASVVATGDVRGRDERHQLGIVGTAFAEIAVEVNVHMQTSRVGRVFEAHRRHGKLVQAAAGGPRRLGPPYGYFFGRNAFTNASFVVRYGPSIRSIQ